MKARHIYMEAPSESKKPFRFRVIDSDGQKILVPRNDASVELKRKGRLKDLK